MGFLDNLIIILLLIASFAAGMTIANRYNRQSAKSIKDALERQYVRLRAGADADDPVKPYMPSGYELAPLKPIPTGDYDGDPPPAINTQFMDKLKQTGRASIKFNKAGIAK